MSDSDEIYDCLICTEEIHMFGIFDCGHYCCGVCSLRIFSLGKQPCPICRKESKRLIITDSKHPHHEEDTFDMAIFAAPFEPGQKRNAKAVNPSLHFNKRLNSYIDGEELAERVSKMVDYLCPMPECWDNGHQEPFTNMKALTEHLKKDHQLRYCNICLENRPVFQCEQKVYADAEIDQHNRGKCKKDSPIFQGHPLCLFCGQRFYDGEALLKHMMQKHYTCDVCNSREFQFTFYKNRTKLLDHFSRSHKLCNHPDCGHLDPMERVFRSDVELQAHQQRCHGAQTRSVDLASLGFRFGVGGSDSTAAGGAPAATSELAIAPGLSAAGVANTASTHAVKIIFDHVSRREEVNMEPTKTKANHETQHFSLPPHYEKQEVKFIKRLAPAASPSPQTSPSATKKDEPTSNNNKKGGNNNAKFDINNNKKEREPLPNDPKKLNAILKDRLNAHLTKHQFDEFRQRSMDFINNKLLATEYYSLLASYFSNSDDLDDVVEPLVATMPNAQKKEALLAAKRMMSSREAQQIEEHKRKEEAKKKEQAAADRKKHAWGKGKGNSGGGMMTMTLGGTPALGDGLTKSRQAKSNSTWGKGKNNQTPAAVSTPSPVSSPTTVSPAPRATAAFAPSLPGEDFLGGPVRGGGGGGGGSSALRGYVDPQDLPTLDRNPTKPPKGKKGGSMSQWAQGAGGAANKDTGIWFKKNKK